MFNVNSNKILASRKLGMRLFIESKENHIVFLQGKWEFTLVLYLWKKCHIKVDLRCYIFDSVIHFSEHVLRKNPEIP